jgi:tRNA(Ile)-lysidine synthase
VPARPVDPVAELRRAVRSALGALDAAVRAAPPLVACSGGADSLALLAAAVAVRAPAGPPVHAAVVDHGLQDGSPAQAAAAAELAEGLGAVVAVVPVRVAGAGGPEAAARRARYAALRAARPHPDSPVLLGHTLDDQAETVLLGLGRGSGARSMAGMRTWDPPWLRPLLGVRRATTRAACAALGLPAWDDPHNTDPRFTRSRLRHDVLPLMEEVLGGGVAAALARTAEQLREDGDALDAAAAAVLATARDGDAVLVAPLAAAPGPVRRRALREHLLAAGATAVTDAHLRAAAALAEPPAGRPVRRTVALPGGLELLRERDRLVLRPARWPCGR